MDCKYIFRSTEMKMYMKKWHIDGFIWHRNNRLNIKSKNTGLLRVVKHSSKGLEANLKNKFITYNNKFITYNNNNNCTAPSGPQPASYRISLFAR